MTDTQTRTLRPAHISMQFSDSKKQMAEDVERIFARAEEKKWSWVTGTEAGGEQTLHGLLRDGAKEADYRYWRQQGQDSWVAVREDLIDGGWETWYSGVIVPGVAKHYTSKGVPSVSWDNDELGRLSVLTCHYLTKGRPGAPAEYSQNVEENKALAKAIGERAIEVGKGANNLAFYAGDQNIADRVADTFFGEPLTSAWDEIRKWENTGHGNIDVIASFDRDKRVVAKWIRALDDSEFHLNTDHFLVEAAFEVGLAKR